MKAFLLILMTFVVGITAVSAQSGRLEGTVLDADSGEPLIGVNVVIDELMMGAATDIDGYFSIINVRPGIYTVQASYIGFTPVTLRDVRVTINQTTTVQIRMREQIFSGEEVVIVAERPVIQRDVSSSQVNLNAEEIKNLPVTTVSGVVGLQAGIQGLSVRGGATDEISFNLNGLSLRDERNNQPFTAVSLTSISEIQVQTGGFNAEFGDVQSGIVNVITKEGRTDRYNFDIFYRYDAPGKKHFGPLVNSPNSYWIRPFLDPEVSMTGTQNWDPWTRRQYPDFDGWIKVAENSLSDPNPARHLTPESAQQVFLWQHRKDMAIADPDYVLDFGFGGPMPGVSKMLGNMRFWASHRQTQTMYVIPLATDRYLQQSTTLKITSDIRRGMKLSVEGLLGSEEGTASNNVGLPGMFVGPQGIANSVRNRNSFGNSRIYASDYWAPSSRDLFMIGGKFTHTISKNTYYEVTGSYFKSEYDTNPGRLRDTTQVMFFGNGYGVDEGPFGYWPFPSSGVGSGLRMGVGMSNGRDSTEIAYLTLKYDMTSQLNRYNQMKTGIQFVQTYHNANYGSVDIVLPSGRSQTVWNNKPIRLGVYAQNKFEYEGIVANLGLRLDYSNANTEWINFVDFDPRFQEPIPGDITQYFESEATKGQWALSPRLGVAFPITVNSKLFFNYGHFRSMPTADNLYRIERYTEDDKINRLANPNLPLPKTVAYEIGYEQALFTNYLIRISGYYKDESNIPTSINYNSISGQRLLTTAVADAYRDVKGLELTFSKPRGKFFAGFVNYTYMIRSTGRFGFLQAYESNKDQRNYEFLNAANAQSKPVPQPYARMNLDFFTPQDFGPSIAGFSPLGDWRIGFLGSWSYGYFVTWTGGGTIPGIFNNTQWKDFYNFDMRFSRTLRAAGTSLNVFIDVNNVLNYRYLTQNGFVDGEDYNDYMRSLHLPAKTLEPLRGSYLTVPGDDRPGDYRKTGIPFQPIVAVSNLATISNPHQKPLYYNEADKKYYQYVNNMWVEADKKFVDQVLKDKAYIDMPNLNSFAFFNPRNVLFGVRFSF